MTIVYHQTIVQIRERETKQLSNREIDTIVSEINKMFGESVRNPQTFQDCLDRYCQRKGIRPLIITDIIL